MKDRVYLVVNQRCPWKVAAGFYLNVPNHSLEALVFCLFVCFTGYMWNLHTFEAWVKGLKLQVAPQYLSECMRFWNIWPHLHRQLPSFILFKDSKQEYNSKFFFLSCWGDFIPHYVHANNYRRCKDFKKKKKFDLLSSAIVNLLKALICVLFSPSGNQGQRMPGLPYWSQGWYWT